MATSALIAPEDVATPVTSVTPMRQPAVNSTLALTKTSGQEPQARFGVLTVSEPLSANTDASAVISSHQSVESAETGSVTLPLDVNATTIPENISEMRLSREEAQSNSKKATTTYGSASETLKDPLRYSPSSAHPT